MPTDTLSPGARVTFAHPRCTRLYGVFRKYPHHCPYRCAERAGQRATIVTVGDALLLLRFADRAEFWADPAEVEWVEPEREVE